MHGPNSSSLPTQPDIIETKIYIVLDIVWRVWSFASCTAAQQQQQVQPGVCPGPRISVHQDPASPPDQYTFCNALNSRSPHIRRRSANTQTSSPSRALLTAVMTCRHAVLSITRRNHMPCNRSRAASTSSATVHMPCYCSHAALPTKKNAPCTCTPCRQSHVGRYVVKELLKARSSWPIL